MGQVPMDDTPLLITLARQMIEGLVSSRAASRSGLLDSFRPADRGTRVVERCARFIETACGKCQKADCARCSIAVELRSAEATINAARHAEIAELALNDDDLEGLIVSIVGSLCQQHDPFGHVLLDQWRARN